MVLARTTPGGSTADVCDADKRRYSKAAEQLAADTPVAEAERPDTALFVNVACEATNGNVYTAWVAEPGDRPILLVGYDDTRIPRSVVDLIVARRHGVPAEIIEADFAQQLSERSDVTPDDLAGSTPARPPVNVDEPLEGEPVQLEIGTVVVSITETRWFADGTFPEKREVVVDDGGAPVELSFEQAQQLPAQIRDFADRVENMLANFGHLGEQ
ncbi:hypothetical protein [Streptacidiphilus sp. PAMC 29251]